MKGLYIWLETSINDGLKNLSDLDEVSSWASENPQSSIVSATFLQGTSTNRPIFKASFYRYCNTKVHL